MEFKMNAPDKRIIELKEYISEPYSTLSSWILPILLDVLSKNKHVEYPQKLFEEGLVSVNKDSEVVDYHRLALVSANPNADYTEARQALDFILRLLGIKYSIEEVEHGSFLPGRVGRVVVNDKKVAYIGEIAPSVLSNFDLDIPVSGFELNLSDLFLSLK